ncbi:hypothetical protein BGZ52_012222 [Haplosporangium bisporale]|nr:hypothetical protein BGZ52_012222 [Haplosporangium bisporale]KAF9206694.1 hypothetical protein BGZ59_011543 [Podila verticillata]KFH73900.1 hypothetical protein MVEG_01113 [Podila verticillata NRRL 6337]
MPPKKRTTTRKTKAVAVEAEEAASVEAPTAIDTVEANQAVIASSSEPAEESTKAAQETSKTRKKTTATSTTTTVTTTTTITASAESLEPEVKEVAHSKKGKGKGKALQQEDQEMEDRAAGQSNADEPPTSGSSAPSKSNGGSTMAERMAKLKGLRQQLNASKQANRADVLTEHQKSKVNLKQEMKKERAREEAEQLMAKRDMEEAGEDYERSQFWGYSAESVERWNEKEEAKKQRMDQRFTDWDQVNHKKYLKQVGELKPNLAAYNAKKQASMQTNEDGELVVASDSEFYRDANSVAFLSDAKPHDLAIDRMAADVAKQIDARTRFSKRRAHKEDEDVNYINDANQRFNQKISRFYDKYTKEIRDDFERGTAL